MESTHESFSYLRSKLDEWNANALLLPTTELSWARFHAVATREILPVLCEAKEALAGCGKTRIE